MSYFKKTLTWLDERTNIRHLWQEHLANYYVPKNFNIWYVFGSLALVVFVSQIISGLWLAMFYIPSPEKAFSSVEYIMNDVQYGWLLRYIHSTGASAFFIIVYLHMFRALLYGSYKSPRELVWIIGLFMYVTLLAEAFMGYLLPWGQMSYWGAQVITNVFGAVPFVGDKLLLWLRGDYTISGATLNRFYALHIVGMPLILIFLIWQHISALHKVGSNNPEGIEIREHLNKQGVPLDGIPFHPYYTVKDLYVIAIFLLLFCAVIFFAPTMGGYFLEHDNFIAANPLRTPENISPVWYMTPFYAILRGIPNKLLGITALQCSILILFFLPWLDRCEVKSIRYRGLTYKIALVFFVISFISLGYLGTVHATNLTSWLARLFALIYFLFFILMPFYTRFELVKPVPKRIRR